MKIGFISGWGVDEKPLEEIINRLLEEGSDIECIYYSWADILNLNTSVSEDIDIFIGWSLGGLISLNYDAKAHVLISSCGRLYNGSSYSVGVSPGVGVAMINLLKKDRDLLVSNFCTIAFRDDSFKKYYLKSIEQFDTEDLIIGLEYLFKKDNIGCLGSKNILGIAGDNDLIIPLEATEYATSNSRQGKLYKIKDAGHDLIYTHRQQVIDIIQRFYNEL